MEVPSRQYPFDQFCKKHFSGTRPKAIRYNAAFIGCREPDLLKWCLGSDIPEPAELAKIHRTVCEFLILSQSERAEWLRIIELPLEEAAYVPPEKRDGLPRTMLQMMYFWYGKQLSDLIVSQPDPSARLALSRQLLITARKLTGTDT